MTALLLAALLAAPAPPPSSPLLHSRSRTGHAAPAVPALRIQSVQSESAIESIAVDQPAAGVTVRAARPEPAGPIEEYARLRPEIRKLISLSYDLGRRNLRYLYGSADPQLGGLDCSGAVYYLMERMGVKNVPRQANTLCDWVREHGFFQSGCSLEELAPGDLLFWSGTYRIDRDITHVMIYLGRDRRTGEPLMFGAERGGVRVTGFRNDGRGMGRFVGYGRIPGLTGR